MVEGCGCTACVTARRKQADELRAVAALEKEAVAKKVRDAKKTAQALLQLNSSWKGRAR
jgi:hypothetical protein